MTTKPKTAALADLEAQLAARLAEIELREKAVAEREAALPKPKFTYRDIHRAVLAEPTINDAALTELATKAGAEFKPAMIRTQRNAALAFIKLAKEGGHWQDKAA